MSASARVLQLICPQYRRCPQMNYCKPRTETPVVQEILVNSVKDGRRVDKSWLDAASGLAGG